jgi:hypothetical protein
VPGRLVELETRTTPWLASYTAFDQGGFQPFESPSQILRTSNQKRSKMHLFSVELERVLEIGKLLRKETLAPYFGSIPAMWQLVCLSTV